MKLIFPKVAELELRVNYDLQELVFSLNDLVYLIILNYKPYFNRAIWSKLEIFFLNFSVQMMVLFTSKLWFQGNAVIFSTKGLFSSLAQRPFRDYRR